MSLEHTLAALKPSFMLLGEITGKQATEPVMKLHAEHYTREKLAMDDVNVAVEHILLRWTKAYWPAPEDIAEQAREIARRARFASLGQQNRAEEMEEAYARVDVRKWQLRRNSAHDWREANPERYPQVERLVKQGVKKISRHSEWMRESEVYRKAFREGALVQACNTQAGIDHRREQLREAMARAARASKFAAAGEMDDGEDE